MMKGIKPGSLEEPLKKKRRKALVLQKRRTAQEGMSTRGLRH